MFFDPSKLPVRRLHGYCNPLGFMCIPEIRAPVPGIFQVRTIQRLNKGVAQEKTKYFSISPFQRFFSILTVAFQ